MRRNARIYNNAAARALPEPVVVVHYLVFRDRPGDAFRFTLEAWEVGTVRHRVVTAADNIGDIHGFSPRGYDRIGVPDGPHMTEVWVKQ